ncbi:type II secretion system minor pseudopilin GspK [Plesiomonas shigelloides]|uniref:Type II secretion system minor pseudopilin GspK n=1 Tax=Plesiomonas shigelloides TaxID=703 RepID=A0A8I2B166_PLESH|nr:type II secretion system minor pseudopilin GspK [Plesiomonas shigelloides]MBO1106676.1 type II secretion system minor pseudopilin GspK [Plesiomonas shigelloides]
MKRKPANVPRRLAPPPKPAKTPKRGMAMVIVMVLLAVMTLLAANMSGRIQQQIGLALHQQEYQALPWLTTAAESQALRLLRDSVGLEPTVNLSQAWAQEDLHFALPQGRVSLALSDLQACFNLNALHEAQTSLAGQTSGSSPNAGEGGGENSEPENGEPENSEPENPTPESAAQNGTPLVVRQLLALLKSQDVPEYRAELLADNLWEFIDADSVVQTAQGREDSEYLARDLPFYPPNSLLTDVSEIRPVQGMDAELYQRVAPVLCAIPEKNLRINVNTLGEDNAPLLEAVFTPYLSRMQAEQILRERPQQGWESVAAFLQTPALADVDSAVKQRLKTLLTVSSDYFRLSVRIEMNGVRRDSEAVIGRSASDRQGFYVLWHQQGDLE